MKLDKTTQFIEKAKNIHRNKYDYSYVEYHNRYTPVKIVCHEHGIFEQKPLYHTQKRSGCPTCYRDSQKYDQQKFLQLAYEKFGDQFTYGVYKGFQQPISITCNIHNNDFETTPMNHLINKGGCLECWIEGRSKPREQWIQEFNEHHNYKYDYSQSEIIKCDEKITVLCPEHGPFYPTPNNHKVGHGCPECAKPNYPGGYSEEFFQCNPDKIDELGTLYKIYIWDENESFYKVGITSRNVHLRFKNLIPYNYEILEEQTMTLYEAHVKEQDLLSTLTRYTPDKLFPGWTECVESLDF